MSIEYRIIPGLHARSSVAELEKALREERILHPDDWDYAGDRHFAGYAFNELVTAEDALRFADELDRDNKEQNKPPFDWGCTKARGIREWLTGKHKHWWSSDSRSVRVAVSAQRRTCCGCHETGSYKRLDQMPRWRVRRS